MQYASGMDKMNNEMHMNLTGSEADEENVGINMVFLHQIMFFVSKNGTLTLPENINNQISENTNNQSSIQKIFNNVNDGYSLAPGATATFTFNKTILYGNGKILGKVLNNTNYSVILIGNNNSFTYRNITSK